MAIIGTLYSTIFASAKQLRIKRFGILLLLSLTAQVQASLASSFDPIEFYSSTVSPVESHPATITLNIPEDTFTLVTLHNRSAEVLIELLNEEGKSIKNGYDEYQIFRSQLLVTPEDCRECTIRLSSQIPDRVNPSLTLNFSRFHISQTDRFELESEIQNLKRANSQPVKSTILDSAPTLYANSKTEADQLRQHLYPTPPSLSHNSTGTSRLELLEKDALNANLKFVALSKRLVIVRDNLWRKGKTERALSELEALIKNASDESDHEHHIEREYILGRAHLLIGMISSRKGAYSDTDMQLKTAEEHFRNVGHNFYIAETLSESGIAKRYQNKFQEATLLFEKAYQESASNPKRDRSQILRIQYQMAAVSILTGQYYVAEKLTQNIDIPNVPLSDLWKAHFYALKGRISLELNKLDSAEEKYLLAWKLYEQQEASPHLRTVAKNLARLYTQSKNRDQAEYYLSLADIKTEKIWGPEHELSAALAKINYLIKNNQATLALQEIDNAEQKIATPGNHHGIGRLLNYKGEALIFEHQYDAATQTLIKALQSHTKANDLLMQSRAHYLLAIASDENSKDKTASLEHLKKSLSTIERIRTNLLDEESRIQYFSLQKDIYELQINLLSQSAETDIISLLAAENYKARTLFENLAQDPDTESTIKKWQSLTDNEALSESFNISKNFNLMHSGWNTTTEESLKEVQETLSEYEAVLSFHLGTKKAHAWLIKRSNITHIELDTAHNIHQAMAGFSADLKTNPNHSNPRTVWKSFHDNGSHLYLTLLSKIQPQLTNISSLTIIPDGALHTLSFGSIPTQSGHPLTRDMTISYAPSLATYNWIKSKKSNLDLSSSILVIANPEVHSSKDLSSLGSLNLPSSEAEALSIIELWPDKNQARALMGKDASKDKLTAALNNAYSIVHFATHAYIDRKNPRNSAIILATTDNEQNSINVDLSLQEISSLDFDAELVVLSSCESGTGKVMNGEGPIALYRALFEAGAKRVLVSLWPVDDDATQRLMTFFYEELIINNLPPAKALQSAQIKMMNHPEYTHPYFWSGFIFMGKPESWQTLNNPTQVTITI